MLRVEAMHYFFTWRGQFGKNLTLFQKYYSNLIVVFFFSTCIGKTKMLNIHPTKLFIWITNLPIRLRHQNYTLWLENYKVQKILVGKAFAFIIAVWTRPLRALFLLFLLSGAAGYLRNTLSNYISLSARIINGDKFYFAYSAFQRT